MKRITCETFAKSEIKTVVLGFTAFLAFYQVGWPAIAGAAFTGTGYAGNSTELAFLLRQQEISHIIFTHNISLSLSDWGNSLGTPDNLVHIVSGRSLTLSSGVIGAPGAQAVLDLNLINWAIKIDEGASLILENLAYTGFSQLGYVRANNSAGEEQVAGFFLWPTVTAAANGAQFIERNSTFLYEAHPCEESLQSFVYQAETFIGNNTVERVDNKVYIPDTHALQLAVLSLVTRRQGGLFNVTMTNHTHVCFDSNSSSFQSSVTANYPGTIKYPAVAARNYTSESGLSPPTTSNSTGGNTTALGFFSSSSGGGSNFPWWSGLILGFGLALLVGLAIYLGIHFRRRRRKKRTPFDLCSTGATPQSPEEGSRAVWGGGIGPQPQKMSPISEASAVQMGKHSSGVLSSREEAQLLRSSDKGGKVSSEGDELSKEESWPDSLPTSSGQGSDDRKGAPLIVGELWRARTIGILDDVEIKQLIGRGSFGSVYKGSWKGVVVAVKVVEHGPESQALLDREATLATSICHPNLVATYRYSTYASSRHLESSQAAVRESEPARKVEHSCQNFEEYQESEAFQPQLWETWMVLEFCERGSLQSFISTGKLKNRDGSPNMVAIQHCLLDVAAAMDHLHALGIVHGDLKPANVLLKSVGSKEGRSTLTCKVADFGLSRLLQCGLTHVSTSTHGTMAYMPPELLKEGRLQPATDAYSFGMLMWEMYTGEQPFAEQGLGQIFYAVVHEKQRPPIPEGCPPVYRRLMECCWADDASQRPPFREILALVRQECELSKTASPPASP